MRRTAAVVLVIMSAVAALVGAGCSSSGAGAPAEVGQEVQAGLPTAYCEVYRELPTDVPEAYVGSADHLGDLDRLIAVAPEPLAPSLQALRGHVASGAITSDPDTKLTESWPADVRVAVERIQSSSEAGC